MIDKNILVLYRYYIVAISIGVVIIIFGSLTWNYLTDIRYEKELKQMQSAAYDHMRDACYNERDRCLDRQCPTIFTTNGWYDEVWQYFCPEGKTADKTVKITDKIEYNNTYNLTDLNENFDFIVLKNEDVDAPLKVTRGNLTYIFIKDRTPEYPALFGIEIACPEKLHSHSSDFEYNCHIAESYMHMYVPLEIRIECPATDTTKICFAAVERSHFDYEDLYDDFCTVNRYEDIEQAGFCQSCIDMWKMCLKDVDIWR